ncbi:hypothetical protein [Bradyrhizobium sp. CCBAU 51627]|uniref:hypothetical protein n=1 Tax=Bradyrhizobium sp. CCBAU 51627 TaxID=1325088 RepID=UPI0023050995|nr:hypothetical protein [Bradyrhizobium sp. CCBAU 51627]
MSRLVAERAFLAGKILRDLQTPDGRRIRAHCTTTSNGGRMLTYVAWKSPPPASKAAE